MTSIKKIESHKRPREKLWERGAEALTKPELLAILLGSQRNYCQTQNRFFRC